MAKDADTFNAMRQRFATSRDAMASGLGEIDLAGLAVEATYFLSVDLAASGIAADDLDFCQRSVREVGLAAIPLSPFYDSTPDKSVIRLCFAKQPATIAAGLDRLRDAARLFR